MVSRKAGRKLTNDSWTKITDALPADRQNCLVYWPRKGFEVCTFQARFYADLHDYYPYDDVPHAPGFVSLDYSESHPLARSSITHWQPLPGAPTD